MHRFFLAVVNRLFGSLRSARCEPPDSKSYSTASVGPAAVMSYLPRIIVFLSIAIMVDFARSMDVVEGAGGYVIFISSS